MVLVEMVEEVTEMLVVVEAGAADGVAVGAAVGADEGAAVGAAVDGGATFEK